MKKRILAILCVVSMLVSAVFVDFSGPKVTEAQEPETELTYITLADTVKGTDGGAQLYEPGFKNTLMSFYATVSGNAVRIHYGGRDAKSREGFGLIFWGSTMEISNAGYSGDSANKLTYNKVTLNASDFGMTTFFNQKILFQFQTEFLALDADGQENDIRFTVYMNKKLAATIEIKDEASKLGNCVRICDGTYKVAGYRELALSEEKDYERWTYSQMGGTDGTLNGVVNTHDGGGSLHETYFQAKMTFPEGNFGQFFLGSGSYYGILLDDGTNGTDKGINVSIVSSYNSSQQWGVKLGTLTEEIAGNLRNKELNIGISVKFVEINTSTQSGNLEIGVWLDGVLYNGTRFVTKGAVRGSVPVTETKLANYIKRVHTQGASNIKITSVTEGTEKTLPTDFEKYTLADTAPQFATVNANTGDVSGYLPCTSLDKVLYSNWIQFSADYQQYHYASTASNSYAGITFYPSDGRANLNIAKVAGSVPVVGVKVSAKDAIGKDAFDTEFLLQFTTEYVDADFDGNQDDLKFGVWFNGVLYHNQYFYYTDAVSHLGMRVTANEAGAPLLTSYYADVPERVGQYDTWTYEDVCVEDQTTEKVWYYTPITKPSLDASVFSGYATFSYASRYVLVGTKGGYDGIGFGSNNDGTLTFGQFKSGALQPYIKISPTQYNMSTFLGNEVKLGIATRLLKMNDNGTLLVEAIPMVNDQVASNRSWIFNITADQFVRNMALVDSFSLRSTDATSDEEAMPENLTTISLSDFGLGKELANWQGNGTYTKTSLDDTKLSFYVNFGDGQGRIHWAKKTTGYSGFAIYRDGDNLVIGSDLSTVANSLYYRVRSAVVTPESVGLTTFEDTEIKLDIVTQYIDMDNDGIEDDAKIGVYINNRLGAGEYLYAIDALEHLGLGFGVNTANILTISEEKATTYTFYDELPAEVEDYAKWTYKDVAIEDGVNTYLSDWYRTIITGATMDQTMFNGYAIFAEGGQYILFGSTKKSYYGYGFVSNSDGTISFGLFGGSGMNSYITFSPADYNVSTFLGERVKLSVATRILSVNEDGTLTVEMFPMINDTFTEKRSCSIKIQANRYTRCMTLIQAVEVESAEVATAEAMPENLTELQLKDFGLENELACWQGNGTYDGTSLDDTKISFRVNFGDGQGRIHWAMADTGYTGFALYRDGENLVMGSDLSTVADSLYYQIWSSVITPASVGLTTFENVELDIDLVTQYLDLDYDGYEDDAKIAVYIEGILANGYYLYAFDALEHLGLGFGVNVANVFTIASTEPNEKEVPKDLKPITLTDARIGIGSGNVSSKFVALESMAGTLFSAKVKFEKDSSRMHLGFNDKTENGYSGIGIRLEGDNLVIGNELGNGKDGLTNMKISHIIITPKQVGLGDTFVGKEFLLQVSIEFVDRDDNGKKDDIKLGVMINGQFFANTYFYIKDQASLLGVGINFNEGGAASYAPYGEVFPELGKKEYVELTARDFMVANKDYTKASVYNTYDFNSLGGKAFTANVSFSKESAGNYGLYLGGDMWSGLRAEVRSNGVLRLSHIHEDGMQTILAEIAAEEVGLKTFFDTKFKLRFTFDVVEGEKGYVNYRLGVYINDKQYKNDYLWLKYAEESALTETIFIYTQKGGTISVESVYPEVDFSIWGVAKDTWRKILKLI